MKHYRVLLCELKSIFRQAVMDGIFAKSREVCGVLTFALYSEDHYDIGAFDRVLDSRHDLKRFWIGPTTPASQSLVRPSSGRRGAFGFWIFRLSLIDQIRKIARHKCSGSGDADFRAKLCQQMNVR